MNSMRDDRRTTFVCAGWWLALALLSYGLLSPQPPKLSAALLPSHLTFWVSKGVHLGAFAFLALVATSLAITPRHRGTLVTILVAYAAVTEFLQTFVEGRYGCVADVCINLTGVTLGVGLALAWKLVRSARSRPSASATATPT